MCIQSTSYASRFRTYGITHGELVRGGTWFYVPGGSSCMACLYLQLEARLKRSESLRPALQTNVYPYAEAVMRWRRTMKVCSGEVIKLQVASCDPFVRSAQRSSHHPIPSPTASNSPILASRRISTLRTRGEWIFPPQRTHMEGPGDPFSRDQSRSVPQPRPRSRGS